MHENEWKWRGGKMEKDDENELSFRFQDDKLRGVDDVHWLA